MIIVEKDLSSKLRCINNAAIDINKNEMRDPESLLDMKAQKRESEERRAFFSTLISRYAY